MIITIDGPSASGKSTIACRVAQKKNFFYINSGLLFRGVAYLLHIYNGYTSDTIAQVKHKNVDVLFDQNSAHQMKYTYCHKDGARVVCNNSDVTSLLKTPLVDHLSSVIGVNDYIRTRLAQLQHEIVQVVFLQNEYAGVIIDGRDSGSTVFKNAQYKFYLTALPEIRAKRICALRAQSDHVSYESVLQSLIERDNRDAQRVVAPLTIPNGAIIIDTSDLTIEQVVLKICAEAVSS